MYQKIKTGSFSFCLLIIFGLVNFSNAWQTITLVDKQGEYPLGLSLEILEDPSGSLSIEDVCRPEYSTIFKPSKNEIPNYGFTNSAYWVRFKVINRTLASTRSPWVLEFGFTDLHYIDLYQFSNEGKIVKTTKTGMMRSIETRDHIHNLFVFLLIIPKQKEHTIYMRFQNESSMTLPLTLRSMQAFMMQSRIDNLLTGIFIGILLIIFGYNLFLFISLRDKSYLYFAAFIVSFFFFVLSYKGLAYLYIWPNYMDWNHISIPLFIGMLLISLLKFSDSFLLTKLQMKVWHRVINITSIVVGSLIIIIPFTSTFLIIKPMILIAIFTFLLLLLVGFILWRRGFRPARYFILSLVIFLLSAISASLVRLGILPSNNITEPQYMLGSILLVFLLSQALADRVKLLKEEKIQVDYDLQKSEQKFKQFFEEIPDAIFITRISDDHSGEIIDVNPAAEKQTGYSKNELIGSSITDKLIADEFDKKLIEENERKLVSGETVQFAEKKKKKDGTEYWTQVMMTAIDFKTEKVALSVNRDITFQKQAEDALQKSEASLQAFINALPDPAFLIDRNKILLVANQALAKGFNKKINEILGKNAFTFLSPDIATERLKKIDQVISTGKSFIFEDSNNDEIHVNYIYPVLDEQDQVSRIAVFALNITERRQLQLQLAQAQKIESIGTLAGGIAHDFNNLLTVINGYSDIILSKLEKDNTLISDVKAIRSAGDRAENLTRQILAFSRKQIYQPKIININNIINDLDKMLHRLISEDINIEKHLSENLPGIKADPGQIEQILINLFVNARDAINQKTEKASEKKITIETGQNYLDQKYVEKHVGSQIGLHVFFCVSDSGIGMSEEIKQKMFDPFFTSKEKGKGTGLGLATVYGIVKQNNGSIFVYSEPGIGTMFKIYWPASDEDVIKIHKTEIGSKDLSGKETILFVEDVEELCIFADDILGELGYQVNIARDGLEALNIARKENLQIDLLITDLVMPEMNGKELATEIKKINPKTQVLFTSGYTENHIVHGGELERDINFLQKPYNVKSLTKKIREILDKE